MLPGDNGRASRSRNSALLKIQRINKCQRFKKKLLGLLNVTHCKNILPKIFR